jgi:hypothetical protein
VIDILYVYTLLDPSTKQVRYVGVTNNPKQRYYQHCCLYRHKDKKYKLANWLKSLLQNNKKPIMRIVETFPYSKLIWDIREPFWINFYKQLGFDLTNIKEGGYCAPTYGFLGKTHSPESIEKIIIAGKNKIPIPWSNETRQKFYKSIKNNRKKIIQINPITNEIIKIHDYIGYAANEMKVTKSAIQNAILAHQRGKMRLCKGFIWKRQNKYE